MHTCMHERDGIASTRSHGVKGGRCLTRENGGGVFFFFPFSLLVSHLTLGAPFYSRFHMHISTQDSVVSRCIQCYFAPPPLLCLFLPRFHSTSHSSSTFPAACRLLSPRLLASANRTSPFFTARPRSFLLAIAPPPLFERCNGALAG